MKYFRNLRQHSAGDTIVEVLLALTVLSLIIGASSVLANRSTRSLQSTQESAVAQRLAQSQLELFRSYIPNRETPVSEDTVLASANGFCMVETTADGLSTIEPKPADSASCKVSEKGKPASELPYAVTLTIESQPDGYIVRSSVAWAGLTVDTSHVDVDYRVYDKMKASMIIDPEAICGLYQVKNDSGVCVPAEPSIKVVLRAVAPDGAPGNLVQPPCTKTSAFTSLNGVPIKLTQTGFGAAAPQTKNTTNDPASGSVVRFESLLRNGTYEVNLPTIPAGYQLCGTEGQTRNVGVLIPGVNPERTVTYTLRPLIPSKATTDTPSHAFPGWHLRNNGGDRYYKDIIFTNPASSSKALTGISASISGDASFKNYAVNTCSGSLNPGASCTFRVYFWPSAGTRDTNYLGNTGTKQATVSLTNNQGVASTTTSVQGGTYSDMMRPGDAVTTPESPWLRSYNSACYNNVDACGYYRTFIAGNGNFYLMNTYCAWRGAPEYNGGNASINMQTDGNFVYYGTQSYMWATMTFGSDIWAQMQSNGYGRLTQGYDGSTVKWLNGTLGGCNPA